MYQGSDRHVPLQEREIKKMSILYGDGIHDDYPAIQEMLDCGGEVILPDPESGYTISQTLVIPSECRLTLPPFALIRLMDGMNCPMIRNRWNTERGHASHSVFKGPLWNYCRTVSVLRKDRCRDFEIRGGVWDFNNMNQKPNPIRTGDFGGHYTGFGMQFFNASRFKISALTLKDPVTYGMNFDLSSDFEVSDIVFDYNHGNPAPINMDGIHLNGNCSGAVLRNLSGACYDDTVALNAAEGISGPITHVTVDGISAEGSHSAVRLLVVDETISDIEIANVRGSFYQYCVGFTKYYDKKDSRGRIERVVVRNADVLKCQRVEGYPFPDPFVFPVFFFQSGVTVENVSFSSITRRESAVPADTFLIEDGARVDGLSLICVSDEGAETNPGVLLSGGRNVSNLNTREVLLHGLPVNTHSLMEGYTT